MRYIAKHPGNQVTGDAMLKMLHEEEISGTTQDTGQFSYLYIMNKSLFGKSRLDNIDWPSPRDPNHRNAP